MKQVLAVIAAIALIGGAYYARTEIIAPSGDTPTASEGPAEAPAGTVACDAVLGNACPAGSDRLDAAALLDAFAGTAAPYEVVIAPSVTLDMITGSARSQVDFDADAEVLATTVMVVVTATPQVRATVDDPCGADPTWTCVAGLVADGTLRTGLADPKTTSDGIVGLTSLAAGFLDGAGERFSLTGFGSAAFLGWTNEARQNLSETGVASILQFNGARNNAAVVTEAEALDVISRAAAADRLSLRYPAPHTVVRVVATGVNGAGVGRAAGGVGDALVEAGWRGPDGTAPDGAPALPADDGLPDGGAMYALRERWT